MKATDDALIARLNSLLKCTLAGINQYFLHARMLKHAGDMTLADHEFKASLEAMKHSDLLVEHILSLGGIPNLQELGRLMIGETAGEMLANDLTAARRALAEMDAITAFCIQSSDAVTALLIGRLAEREREHVGFLSGMLEKENVLAG